MFGHFGEFAYRHNDVPHVRVVLVSKFSKSYAKVSRIWRAPDGTGRMAYALAVDSVQRHAAFSIRESRILF
jgi:hypothetical protein